MSPSIIVPPDKTKGLMQVNERFELPAEMSYDERFPAYLEIAAKAAAKRAAETYTLRGWHWRNDLGVKVDKSDLQIALEDFGTTQANLPSAVNQGDVLKYKYNRIAYVVKMWFVVPELSATTYDNDELAEPDGFVEELPEDGEIEQYG